MATIFEPEVARLVEAATAGTSVQIIGLPGGGRSMLLRDTGTLLEATGVDVLSATGHPLTMREPYGLLAQLGFDPSARGRPGAAPVRAVADRVAVALGNERPTIVCIDDVNFADAESLGVLDIVRSRLPVTILVTRVRRARWASAEIERMVSKWTALTVDVPALRFEEVGEVAQETLGGPIHPDLLAVVMTASAGNLRLVDSVVRGMKADGTTVADDGVWRLSGFSYWGPRVESAARSLVAGLSVPAEILILALASAQIVAAEQLMRAEDQAAISELDAAGLLTVIEGQSGDLGVTVSYPLLIDLASHLPPGVVRSRVALLSSRLNPALASASPMEPGAARPVKSDQSTDIALSAHFTQTTAGTSADSWSRWYSEPTLDNAVECLRAVWDANPVEEYLERIFRETEVDWQRAAPHSLLPFVVMNAEWLATRHGDVDQAKHLLDQLGQAIPAERNELLAYAIGLEIMLSRLPKDYAARLQALADPRRTDSVVPTILAYAYMVDARASDAVAVLQSSDEQATGLVRLVGLRMLTRILSQYLLGDVDGATAVGDKALAQARASLDKRQIISAAYGAAVVNIEVGRWPRAEQLMGSALTVGRPGVMTAPVYAAVLRLDGFIAARSRRPGLGRALAATADEVHSRMGSLPAMWPELAQVTVALTDEEATPERARTAAEAMKEVARECVERGYTYSALGAYHIALGLWPDLECAREVSGLAAAREIPHAEQYIELVGAVIRGDNDEIRTRVEKYEPDPRQVAAVQVLRAAVDRARAEGDSSAATALQESLEVLRSTLDPAVTLNIAPLAVEDQVKLSSRELEIALLVGTLTNLEVADRLHISVRTVESHVTNALRKTGLSDRSQLFAYASEAAREASRGR